MFSLNAGGLFTYFLNLWQIDSTARPVPYYIIFFSLLLVTIGSGYLLGSINPSIIFSRLLHHDDIRNHGSGNAGMTNVLRTYGKKSAFLTLAGDTLKTALAVFVGGLCFGFGYVGGIATGEAPYIAGLFAVVGHIYPAYYKLKGGKGVLVTATMALILTPIPFVRRGARAQQIRLSRLGQRGGHVPRRRLRHVQSHVFRCAHPRTDRSHVDSDRVSCRLCAPRQSPTHLRPHRTEIQFR